MLLLTLAAAPTPARAKASSPGVQCKCCQPCPALPRRHSTAGTLTRLLAKQVNQAAVCYGHFPSRGSEATPRSTARASSAAATITQHWASTAPRRLIYFNDPAFSCVAARQTLNTQGKYQITPAILYTEGKQKLDSPPCLGRRRDAATP